VGDGVIASEARIDMEDTVLWQAPPACKQKVKSALGRAILRLRERHLPVINWVHIHLPRYILKERKRTNVDIEPRLKKSSIKEQTKAPPVL
jgi:hypothetical protein